MPANDNTYRPSNWGGSKFFDLEVPSGGTVQCQRLTPETMLTQGILHQADLLAFTVQDEVVGPAKGKKKPADRPTKKLTKAEQKAAQDKQVQDLLGDQEQMGTMMSMVDKICVAAVVQPKLSLHFTSTRDAAGKEIRTDLPADERDPEGIYTDSVPMEDKMEIFQRSFGGVQAMQSFRELSKSDAGTVAIGEGAEVSSE